MTASDAQVYFQTYKTLVQEIDSQGSSAGSQMGAYGSNKTNNADP